MIIVIPVISIIRVSFFSILMSKLDELPIVWRCGFEFNLNIDGDFYGRGEDLRVSMGYEVEKHMID